MMKQNQLFVLSVGGSLVAPKTGIDVAFLRAFKTLITKHARLGKRFVIVVGGGATARHYQDAARRVGKLTRDDIDWLGIHATRMNGHLLRTILRDVAHPVMIKDPTRPIGAWDALVLVAAGWKPGWSTDYVATRLAKKTGATTIANLSNIDYVYDKDPNKFKAAKKIEQISWSAFRKMVGDVWDPGMHVPFDPIASKLAEQQKMCVAIVNGADIKNLDRLLSGKPFKGTRIEG